MTPHKEDYGQGSPLATKACFGVSVVNVSVPHSLHTILCINFLYESSGYSGHLLVFSIFHTTSSDSQMRFRAF